MQPFSMTLIQAVAYGEVIAMQLVEGGVDAVVYENFVREIVDFVASQQKYAGRHVVLFMDNAAIHRHDIVLQSLRERGVIVLFNAQYSPQLNPVEVYFKLLKKHVKDARVDGR